MDNIAKEIAGFIKKAYEKPFLSAARLRKTDNQFLVESSWVHTDVEKNEKSHFKRSWFLSKNDIKFISSGTYRIREDVKAKSVIYPDGKYVQIVEIKVGEKTELVIELWDDSGRIKRVAIDEEVEAVNSDSHISGTPQLSPDASYCIFAAELKTTKKSFYQLLSKKKDDGESCESKSKEPSYGTKYHSTRSWGEQIEKVISPKLVKVNFDDGKIQVQQFEGFSCGDAQISSDGKVVFCALQERPFKLGRIFCTNRPMSVYQIQGDDISDCKRLTDQEFAYRLPRFIPKTNTLIMLKRLPYGPHLDCDQIVKLNTDSMEEIVLVDTVHEFPETELDYPGTFPVNFLPEPFLCVDGQQMLVFETCWKNTHAVVTCNLADGKICRIPESVHSASLLDIKANAILFSEGNENEHSCLKIALFESAHDYQILTVSDFIRHNDHLVETFDLIADDSTTFQAKLQFKPDNNKLVLYPHGGPHGNSYRYFSILSHIFVENGYDFLTVNYRGSIGYGSEFVTKLPGKCGEVEVSDCLKALDHVKTLKNYENNFVFGFSHGGWITAHVTAARPNCFTAACLGNPVINLVTCYPLSDIPDWAYYEAFGEHDKFNFGKALDAEQMIKAFSSSPISKVDQVKCPTLMIIGQKDLRVPPNQGIEWIRALERNQVKTLLIEYPKDNHSLSTTETNLDLFIQIYKWFEESSK